MTTITIDPHAVYRNRQAEQVAQYEKVFLVNRHNRRPTKAHNIVIQGQSQIVWYSEAPHMRLITAAEIALIGSLSLQEPRTLTRDIYTTMVVRSAVQDNKQLTRLKDFAHMIRIHKGNHLMGCHEVDFVDQHTLCSGNFCQVEGLDGFQVWIESQQAPNPIYYRNGQRQRYIGHDPIK